MSRKLTRLFSSAVLLGLAVIFSACTFPSLSSTTPDYNATQTAFSFLFTQIATTPSPTITPFNTNSPTPSPTLDPFFLTLTPPVVPTFITPTTGPRPLYYTLQSGEFPYCIARRFNIDPRELLAINNLSSGLILCSRVGVDHSAIWSPIPIHPGIASPSGHVHRPRIPDDRLQSCLLFWGPGSAHDHVLQQADFAHPECRHDIANSLIGFFSATFYGVCLKNSFAI